ncbi:MAG: helix-turn-helix transcriptional regulator [Bacteroidota bacterium]|nr:helix-turn-helix transcriptional regulator [Bacteroidota bacterium]
MYVKKDPTDYLNCSVRIAIDILSTSWNAWLIQEINNGVVRPSDLHRAISVAPKRVLTKQLGELEKQGILGKKVYPVLPLKVEYYLTDIGKELLPILDKLNEWGDRYKDVFVEQSSEKTE